MIVGAMKSGTTCLYHLLCQHPEIASCRVKEPEFFSQRQPHGLTCSNYYELWNFCSDTHQYALEASTGYSKKPFESGVAQRIVDYGLQPKIIYLVRDPIERIVSEMRFSMRVAPNNTPNDITAPRYLALSRYHNQLSDYVERLSIENILVLDFKQLCEHLPELMTKVHKFLELPAFEYDYSSLIINSAALPSARAHSRFSTLRYYWSRLTAQNSSQSSTIRVNRKQQDKLRAALRPDIERFGAVHNFPIQRWGF